MRLPRATALCAVTALLVLASCAPKRTEVALDPSAVPPARLLDLVHSAQERVRSLTGHGNIAFESPDLSGSATFEISVKRPDSLLARFEGPFGIDVGTLFLSRRRFVLYNSMENEVTTGVPSGEAIRKVVPFDLTYDQILSAFTGIFVIGEKPGTVADYSVDDDQFRLTFTTGGWVTRYWVEPATMMVTRFAVTDTAGATVVEATASRFKDEEGAQVPRRIMVTFPRDRRSLTVAYQGMSVNSTETSFSYSIPSNAHRISR